MKKLLIDARMVGLVPHGIGIYVADLARALSLVNSKSYEPAFLLPSFLESELKSKYPWNQVQTVWADSRFLHPSEWLEIPRILKREGVSLYHSPSFASLPFCPVAWVQTIHDLNHLKFGSFAQKIYYRSLLRPFATRAKALMTVSEFSRAEIREWIGASAPPLTIVPNVIDDRRPEWAELDRKSEEVCQRYSVVPGRYLICVSNPKPHKNLNLLADAYVRAAGDDPGISEKFPLLLTVLPEDLEMEKLGFPRGIRPVGPIANDDLSVLIRAARAVAFPSLYEGFGRPPVEAALLGVPSLVSMIRPHRESLRSMPDGTIRWLRPDSKEDWVLGILAARRGELTRPRVQDLDFLSEAYSLKKMGMAVDRVYQGVLGMNA